MQNRSRPVVYSILIGILLAADGQAGVVEQAVLVTGVEAGLCANLGSTDGAVEIEAAKTDRFLVHGLTTTAAGVSAARAAIAAQGLYGVASVERVATLKALVYADNLVNLLVADMDQLGSEAPAETEILRVLTPEGAAYLRDGGNWRVLRKPWPAGMDEWSQVHYGPEGNPVSHDRLAGPTTGVQWLGWYGYCNHHGLNGEPTDDIRVTRDGFYQHIHYKDPAQRDEYLYLDARDPFNGVSLWTHKVETKGNRSRVPRLTVADGRVYALTQPGEPLSALDGKTGEVLQALDRAGKAGPFEFPLSNTIAGDLLMVACRESLVVLDRRTGDVRWTYTEGAQFDGVDKNTMANRIMFPIASVADNRAFCAVAVPYNAAGYGKKATITGRVPAVHCKAIVCFELSTGKRLWRISDEIKGKGAGELEYPNIAQLCYKDGYLLAFGDLMYHDPFLASIKVADGTLLWMTDCQGTLKGDPRDLYLPSYWKFDATRHGQTWWVLKCMLRDNLVYGLASSGIIAWDPATGTIARTIRPQTVNNRCATPTATDTYFIQGFSAYIRNDDRFCFTSISRGSCGGGAIPACGMIYTSGNAQCGCFTKIRQAAALSCGQLSADVPDANRLETGSGMGKTLAANAPAAVTESAAWPVPPVAPRTPITSGNPIRADWNNNDYIGPAETAPLTVEGRTYVGVINEHRLECRNGTAVVWSYTAGGRISTPPVVSGGLCFFGSHDGYVYCLRRSDGALAWRFLAARTTRRIVVHSQIEAASPVFGVVMNQGKICASAGRHPEADGGIYVWGLEPVTGAIAWKSIIRRELPMEPLDSRAYAGYANRILNAAPTADGGIVNITGAGVDPANPANPGPVTVRIKRSEESAGLRVSVSARGVLFDTGSEGIGLEARLLDARGRTLVTHRSYGTRTSVLPTENLAPGYYVVRATCGGAALTRYVNVAASR